MQLIKEDHVLAPGAAEDCNPSSSIPEMDRIVTSDSRFKQILANLPFYAALDLPVLLQGEPGTGKELVARALYAQSRRRYRPFSRINCGALTESLACSELFGHLQGSFTDARTSRAGKFKAAHRGTLFLDEVGDLPLSIQPRLLRAVEQGEIEPVGGDNSIQVDVRLLAASNQDLPHLIAQGRFRQDLYDRLAVLVINLPPLRERGDDILLLAHHFARKEAQRFGRGKRIRLTAAALRLLYQHPWPGNVRELKNVITRAILFSSDGVIRDGDLYFTSQAPATAHFRLSPAMEPGALLRPTCGHLEEMLKEESGNISALSRRLKVCTKTIYRWLKSYQLDPTSLREIYLSFAVLPLTLCGFNALTSESLIF